MSTSRILHRQTNQTYPVAVRGQGVFLFDKAGKDYLDASGGAAVSCLGHGHPKVIAAIKDQVDRLAYAHSGFFTTEPAEELADWLISRAPAGFARAVFVSGGTEAVEAAVKLARQVHFERGEHRRTRFIARRQSYHGTTLGMLALGHHTARRRPYQGVLDEGLGQTFSHISPCHFYRYGAPGETEDAYAMRAAAELEAEILRLGAENVAGFVAETISGATLGVVPPARGYLREIRRICDAYGIFLILDEVMCGMGRTGTMHAFEQDGVAPDFVAIAKGLGAGYQPIGAVIMQGAHARAIEDGSAALAHGHTYMAHPVACAGALAVQRVIEEEDMLSQVRARSAHLLGLLRERFDDHPNIGDIRGRGLFIGMEFVAERAAKAPFAAEAKLAARLKTAAMANGLICYPGSGGADGSAGDHVLLAPPFIISQAESCLLVERLGQSIERALGEVRADKEHAAHVPTIRAVGADAGADHGGGERRAAH